MSNPKGLKNIPAIRQKVAMFLRNICLQVITIHLFGFKVYEFEKNQILFNKYFVRMNILYIFVEIIKKSTTMKNILNILVGLLLSVNVFGQYNVDEIKKEFDILYQQHLDSLHTVKTIHEDLSPLCMYHLNYCVKKGFVTHFEDDDSTMYGAKDRYLHFFPHMDGSGYKGGEVMCRYESGLKLTDKEMAKRMFNCYMHSKAHKKMLEDKKLTYYNFEFSVDPNSPNNVVFSIGFLSSLKVK